MIKSHYKRVGKQKQISSYPEQRIKNLFNNDILENVQLRRTQFLNSIHPNPKNLIQEGYIVHSLPLRNCDIQKIYNKPRNKTFSTPDPKQEDTSPSKSQIKIQRLMTSAQKDKLTNMTIDDNCSIIAQLPAFYPRNQQNNRQNQAFSSTQTFAIRIKSLSRVKDSFADTKLSNSRSASDNKKKKRLSQRKLLLQYQINCNSFLYESYFN